MKNLAFVFWMLGWPVVMSLGNKTRKYSESTEFIAAIITVAAYICVAALLYEG